MTKKAPEMFLMLYSSPGLYVLLIFSVESFQAKSFPLLGHPHPY